MRSIGYGALFVRFLKLGALAWGGPVAQIARLRHELVDEERWVDPDRFHRALALYQVLPGPEATELCVYFGMVARGRVGGVLAGLGFILPGFILMFGLSALYVSTAGAIATQWHGVFAALQAAVVALIVRAVHRIGKHALQNRVFIAIAAGCFVGALVELHFAVHLAFAGLLAVAAARPKRGAAIVISCAWAAATAWAAMHRGAAGGGDAVPAGAIAASLPWMFWIGLRAGLLTFGGAYTAIPFLRDDAVTRAGWLTQAQFLDGLALSGILPAPLIIFSTFVGYVAGGPAGSVVLTAGIFLPAFAFTLAGHEVLEKWIQHERLRRFLDGVAAGVVGMIAATAVELAPAAVRDVRSGAVFAGALLLLYLLKHRLAVLLVIGLAAAAGALIF